MPNLRVLPLALLLIAAAACFGGGSGGGTPTPSATSEPATPSPTPEPTPNASYTFSDCRFEVPEDYEATCGFLTVPENRSVPDSRNIRLHVAVFKSTSDTPDPDPVIYLDGGPGGETLKTVPLSFENAFAHLLDDRDLVLFDQRGVGTSEPALECPEVDDAFVSDVYQVLTEEEANAIFVEAATLCRDRLTGEGIDVSAYNSAESAADVDALRQVLGYEQWNLYGISYGTRLALTVARDYPQGVRSIVLDSTYSPEVDLYGEDAENTVRALKVLFDNCAADSFCASTYPQLEQVFVQQLQRLQAEPVRETIVDPLSGEFFPQSLIDGDALFGAVFQSLYDETAFPLLPQLIYDVQAGDYALLTTLLGFFLAQQDYQTSGMYLAVQCHEEAPFSSPAAVRAGAAQYPVYEQFLTAGVDGLFDGCAAWSDSPAGPVENEPVVTDIPTLVAAGEWDPITPPRWGEAVASRLPNAVFVEFPGLGHGVTTGHDCPRGIMRAFLADPAAQPDTSCVASMGGPDFSGGGF